MKGLSLESYSLVSRDFGNFIIAHNALEIEKIGNIIMEVFGIGCYVYSIMLENHF